MGKYLSILRQDQLKSLYKRHGITYVGLFGSASRGDDTPKSDIDLLIDFDQTKTLFDLARVKLSLQEILGREIDLTIKGSIKSTLKPFIEKDLVTVYDQN